MLEFALDFGYTPKEFGDLYIDEFEVFLRKLSEKKVPKTADSLNQLRMLAMGVLGIKEPAKVEISEPDVIEKLSGILPIKQVDDAKFREWLKAEMPNPNEFFSKRKK